MTMGLSELPVESESAFPCNHLHPPEISQTSISLGSYYLCDNFSRISCAAKKFLHSWNLYSDQIPAEIIEYVMDLIMFALSAARLLEPEFENTLVGRMLESRLKALGESYECPQGLTQTGPDSLLGVQKGNKVKSWTGTHSVHDIGFNGWFGPNLFMIVGQKGKLKPIMCDRDPCSDPITWPGGKFITELWGQKVQPANKINTQVL
ncbi:hypothetical protein VNO77_19265 [Canavalia gladiata]|uniref:Uncharacterized protein n=1 Tax=Canavalia gladiata TaxID=3824 RepID=A0AAN9QPF9_CANGL